MLKVIKAEYLDAYRLWLQFDNGSSGEIDLEDQLWGPGYETLKDITKFKKFKLSHTFGTIVWGADIDFAPEFLFEKIKRNRK